MHISKRIAASVAAAGTTLALGGMTAVPGLADAATGVQQITVTMSPKHIGFSDGNTVSAGRTKFTVVSKNGDRQLQLMRLAAGYTGRDAKRDVGRAFSGNTKAIARIDKKITWLGGAEATDPDTPGVFEETLYAGSYVAVDFNSNVVTRLTVVGTPAAAGQPTVSSTVTAVKPNVFHTGSKTLPHFGWMLWRNRAAEPHMLVMQEVAKGTTRHDVEQYINSGGQGQPSWIRPAFTSASVISPGTQQYFHYRVPRGRYIVTCFWPSIKTGAPHFAMGMFKLVDLK